MSWGILAAVAIAVGYLLGATTAKDTGSLPRDWRGN